MQSLVARLNAWLEHRTDTLWFRSIDRAGRIAWLTLVAMFAVAGLAVAGWALYQGGLAGVLFAVIMLSGVLLLVKHAR